MRNRLAIRASLSPAPDGTTLLAPWAACLSPARRDLIGMLPVFDLNGRNASALDALPRGVERSLVVAGLYVADPFLRPRDETRRLRAAGIEAVANFPPVGLVDGEAGRAFETAGVGPSRETAVLEAFLAEGIAVTGFACTLEHAKALEAIGAGTIILHPGIPVEDWRERAAAGIEISRILSRLRSEPTGARLLVYRPFGFGAELDHAVAAADGLATFAD